MKTILNILYKIYSFTIALPIFVVITIFVASSVIIAGFLGDTDVVAYYLPKFWSKCAFWLFLLKVKVEGRENIKKEDSYVFLANHQGYYDIFLAYGYLGHNFKWMMKEYLKKIPFVGYACVKSKHIYLPDGISGIAKAVQQARETLQGGMSMIIFPEGTRTRTGKMGPFKRGRSIDHQWFLRCVQSQPQVCASGYRHLDHSQTHHCRRTSRQADQSCHAGSLRHHQRRAGGEVPVLNTGNTKVTKKEGRPA